jgi:hypothetical protein
MQLLHGAGKWSPFVPWSKARCLQYRDIFCPGCVAFQPHSTATSQGVWVLDDGMFSADADCMCRGIAVCRACRRIDYNSRRLITQHRYQGDHPRGKEHWFGGRTDAVGDVAHGQLMWLSCNYSPRIQECIVL